MSKAREARAQPRRAGLNATGRGRDGSVIVEGLCAGPASARAGMALWELPVGSFMSVTSVELSLAEAVTVLSLVRARFAELERMVQNLEEGEGMDAGRYNALRALRPQVEAFSDLVLKLEGAVKELEARKR